MNPVPLIYTSRSDCELDYLEKKRQWNIHTHGPDLIEVGFYSVQCYQSEAGEPLLCNIYEIPDVDIFRSQAYADIASRDPQREEVMSKLSRRSNSIYEQVRTANPPGRTPGLVPYPVGRIAEPWATTLRLDIDPDTEAALVEWYERTEFRRLGTVPGFRSGRLCRQSAAHPTAKSQDPRWLALLEWESRGAAEANGRAGEVIAHHEGRFPGRLSRVAHNLLTRIFRAVHPTVAAAAGRMI